MTCVCKTLVVPVQMLCQLKSFHKAGFGSRSINNLSLCLFLTIIHRSGGTYLPLSPALR